jgi:hypothetical protein
MKKIFLVKQKGFPDFWSICTNIVQYGFDPERLLFTYHDHIMVNRKVTRKEAEILLELIMHNGSGRLCGGEAEEIIEL